MADKKYVTLTLTLPDGTRKYFRGKTKKEAEKKRNEMRMQIGMGIDVTCDMTVEELADMWFKLYKESDTDLHVRSKETTQGILTRYIIPTIGKMRVADVKPIHIQQLMNSVKKLSNSTQSKVLQTTRAMFIVAEENGMVLKSPVGKSVKAGGAKTKEKQPLTREQSDALLLAVEGTRAHLLITILLNAGLRIGEALGLMWSDVDFTAGTITVNRSIVYPKSNLRGEINNDLKTDNAHRTIPIPWVVVEELRKEQKRSNSVWVFSMKDGRFLSYTSFQNLWGIVNRRSSAKRKVTGRELVERTLDFSVHPHLLRHTCVTRWFEQGLDIKEIQYLAGHATPDITLRVYTHYLKAERFAETAAKIQAMA